MDSWWTKNKWIPLSVAAGILKFVKHTPTISEFWAGRNLVRLNYLLEIFFCDDVSVSLHIGCIALNCIFISATRCKMRGGVLKKRFWINIKLTENSLVPCSSSFGLLDGPELVLGLVIQPLLHWLLLHSYLWIELAIFDNVTTQPDTLGSFAVNNIHKWNLIVLPGMR